MDSGYPYTEKHTSGTETFSNVNHPLTPAYGYGIVLGLGFTFAFVMICTTWLLKRYQNEKQTVEQFTTAGRVVKTGLVACSVVSSWTWSATLLQSSGVAYRYGVSGPFWYASGATIQILLFATLAIELKRRAPNAHTFLEAIRARYGFYAHVVFIFFGLFTNILVTAMLLTGGSAVVESITGMPTPVACFMLPIGVVLYTLFGGLKATFMADYIHTCVLMIILLIFAITTYITSPLLGSPKAVYDILVAMAKENPIDGNQGGSYLTMRSREGAMFFIINLVGNFGAVFCDNGYYNKAIAASPVSAFPGYVLGGLSWFGIPWLAATTMGLAGLALSNNPAFPIYPHHLTVTEINAGLVLPMTATALLGKGGAVCAILLIFMVLTSATSAELISVSSICTFDIYQFYFKPLAGDRQLIWFAHAVVILFGVFSAAFSTGLYYVGVSMGYLYLLNGIIISPAVLPAALTLLSKRQSMWAATLSPVLGLACSLITWLLVAKFKYNEITVASTGQNLPMLCGNVVALCSPAIFIPVITYITGPDNYDWISMRQIQLVGEGNPDKALGLASEQPETVNVQTGEVTYIDPQQDEMDHLEKVLGRSKKITIVMSLILLIVWPMPFFGTGYIFSEGFFTAWVYISMAWLMLSTLCVSIYPLYESRKSIKHVVTSLFKDLTGKHPQQIQREWETYGSSTEYVAEQVRRNPESIGSSSRPQTMSPDVTSLDVGIEDVQMKSLS
ncbi:hypothetical protein H072_52 [Dactylellina haptotyla CBS 200.50]|uniref:Urea active transporter n=1 Tax=Dactylellina haptotyla (strain CBS 200.50) TaxID=1284197 RepID=S8ASL5_DACHA|nr:hypothetical protein H072_52 [Dactylellina haptotyla CBS 200.50]